MNDAINFENTELPDILELSKVTQIYDGNKVVIKDLNLLIEDKPGQGQFICILGASGCGKSTILRFIAGLRNPTLGDVLYFGKKEKPPVGMIFQRYSCFPWATVLDNVALPLKLKGIEKDQREQEAAEMIKLVGLEGHEYKFAQYPNLSGGQLQRVAIAMQLVNKPSILLLDEPFGALDIKTRVEMQKLLANLWVELSEKKSTTTFIMVTHDIEEAVFLADELFIMNSHPGRIVERMTMPFGLERPMELKRTKEFIETSNKVHNIMMNLNAGVSHEN